MSRLMWLALLAFSLTSCERETTLSYTLKIDDLESEFGPWLQRETNTKLEKLSCPNLLVNYSVADGKKGTWNPDHLWCTASAAGLEFKVHVALTYIGNGDKPFHAYMMPKPALIMMSSVEGSIQTEVMKRIGVQSKVVCPQRLYVSEPGARFACQVHLPSGTSRVVHVVIKDEEGNVFFTTRTPDDAK